MKSRLKSEKYFLWIDFNREFCNKEIAYTVVKPLLVVVLCLLVCFTLTGAAVGCSHEWLN